MSAAAELIEQLAAQGVSLRAEEGKLVVTAPKGALAANIMEELKARKVELLDLLTNDSVAAAEGARNEARRLAARELLNNSGVRMISVGEQFVLGTWKDADTAELRDAFETLGLAHLAVRYLDDADPDIPERYQDRAAVEGVRHDIPPDAQWISFYEWKARMLNSMFDGLSRSKQRSHITAEEVRAADLRGAGESDRQHSVEESHDGEQQ